MQYINRRLKQAIIFRAALVALVAISLPAVQGASSGSISFTPSGSPVVAPAQATACGSPRFGSAIYGVYQSFVKIIPIDFNGDGHLDLAGLTHTPGQITFLSGDGTGAFTLATTLGADDRANDLAAIDFNHDGQTDIAVISDLPRMTMTLSSSPTATRVGTRPASSRRAS